MNYNWRKLFRILHRDLGYFLIGACLVYALSGVMVTLRYFDVDVVNAKTPFTLQLPKLLPVDSVPAAYNRLRGDLPEARAARASEGGVHLRIPKCRAYYDAETGVVAGNLLEPRQALSFINRLHYNREGEWRFMGMFFSVGFLLLTVTGAFMLKGKKGFRRRGVWFMLGGLALMVVLILI